jgi:hypothetical protein
MDLLQCVEQGMLCRDIRFGEKTAIRFDLPVYLQIARHDDLPGNLFNSRDNFF